MRLADHMWAYQIEQGDEGTFESLIKKYKDKVFNYCLYLVGDYHMAEEITQDVFLKVYYKISQYDIRKSSLSTWIMTIVHNESVNKLHTLRNELVFEEQFLLSTKEHNPEQLILDNEAVSALLQILNTLSKKEKSIILLKDYLGYKIKEISKILDLSEGTVKSTMHGARIKIRERLGDSYDK